MEQAADAQNITGGFHKFYAERKKTYIKYSIYLQFYNSSKLIWS